MDKHSVDVLVKHSLVKVLKLFSFPVFLLNMSIKHLQAGK